MTDYIIATDATIDLEADILSNMGVYVIPMDFIVDGEACTYDPVKPGFDFDGFYGKIAGGATVSTSQIAPSAYMDFFEGLIKVSKKILYICFSSGLSGTYNSACFAAEEIMDKYPEVTIRVVDSLCASVGEGFFVYNACLQRDAGVSFDDLCVFLEDAKGSCQQWFVVGNLDQLKRGGRISSIEAALGTMLHIHPILKVDEEGRLKVEEKVRGMKKAFSTLIDKYSSLAKKDQKVVLVGYAGEREQADLFAASVKEQGIADECIVSRIGPVIGSHTGAPMYAVVFWS